MGRKNKVPLIHVPRSTQGRVADNSYDKVVLVSAGYYPCHEHDGDFVYIDLPEVEDFLVCVEAANVEVPR